METGIHSSDRCGGAAACRHLWMVIGQRSRSHKAEDTFGDLAKVLFSTTLCQVAVLIGVVIGL